MDSGVVTFVAIILAAAYVAFSIWVVSRRKTIGGSIGATVGLAGGGVLLATMIETIATVVCWIVVICIVGFLAALFSD